MTSGDRFLSGVDRIATYVLRVRARLHRPAAIEKAPLAHGRRWWHHPKRAGLFTVIVAVVVAALSARAQDWPQRPVTIVVPFAAGGNTDGIARLTAQRLADEFGTQFVVENRGGAGGALAAEFVAHAPPDGHTLLMAALPQMAILPAMRNVPYDPVRDFSPISIIATNPFVLVASESFPVKTVFDFVAYVRARPNALAYASAGPGSLSHLAMALFLKQAALEMVHVPYKGNAPALGDVVAGHIPVMFSNLSDALPQAAAGTIRLLAVTSANRVPQISNIPTVSESGYPKYKALTWNGLVAPSGTPHAIIKRLAQAISRGVKDATFSERLAAYGVDPLGNDPDEFATMMTADIALWTDAVKAAGVSEK